jgi:hypothetical protein
MRFRTAVSMVALYLFFFTFALWATPVNEQAPAKAKPTAEVQSVSGKIASVGDAEFALDVKQSQKPSTVKFLVDGNTKVEGKLSVGAQAIVEYRAEDGNNIATHVSVLPESGMQPY